MRYLVIITMKSQDELQFRMSTDDYFKLTYQLLKGCNKVNLMTRTGGTRSEFTFPTENVLYIQAIQEEGDFEGTELVR